MSELFKRVAVSFVGIPIAIVIVYFGSWLFLSVVIIISSLALHEFYSMAEKKNIFPQKWSGVIAGILLLLIFYFNSLHESGYWIVLFFVVVSIYMLLIQLWSKHHNALNNIAVSVAGLFYIPLSFSCMLNLRELYNFQPQLHYPEFLIKANFISSVPALHNSEACGWFVMSIFFAVWICDSAAYFVGKGIGKKKLMPRISPKKTWEGAIAGFFGGIGGFWLSAFLLIPHFPAIHAIVIGALIGIFGQIGDLAESQLKRDAGVKDSSSLIPGHGGVLDRFDSILVVVPIIYIYVLLMPLWN